MLKEIVKCRSCGAKKANMTKVLSIGKQKYSGIFPKSEAQDIGEGPLELLRCQACDLTQLAHIYDQSNFFGEDYGYMSSATNYMRNHLNDITSYAETIVALGQGDAVLDIGSNDGTLLSLYSTSNIKRVGVDPSAEKFRYLYPLDAELITAPFSAKLFSGQYTKKFSVITSISMFYDLSDPVRFASEVCELLKDGGVWIFEQSYLLNMLRNNSYDTVCHEHIEYYTLRSLQKILSLSNLKIISASTNDLNGGSIRVTAAKMTNNKYPVQPEVEFILNDELLREHDLLADFARLNTFIAQHGSRLRNLLMGLKVSGKKVLGYGASTKGNVILQNCGITKELLSFIGDVTPWKQGAFTPGSKIPIITMDDAKKMNPDYFLVFPWSFRADIIKREIEFIKRGGKFIFPLPDIEICA